MGFFIFDKIYQELDNKIQKYTSFNSKIKVNYSDLKQNFDIVYNLKYEYKQCSLKIFIFFEKYIFDDNILKLKIENLKKNYSETSIIFIEANISIHFINL